MINSQARAVMRRHAEALMTDTCVITAVGVSGSDEFGGFGGVPTQVYSGKCRVIRAGQQTQDRYGEVNGQVKLSEYYRLIVPYGTALAVDQTVTVNSVIYRIVNLITALTDKVDRQAIMIIKETQT